MSDDRSIDPLQRTLPAVGIVSGTVEYFASRARISVEEAGHWLRKRVESGEFQCAKQRKCSVCEFDLSGTDAVTKCPGCGTAFVDKPPLETIRYTRPGEMPRLIPWFLVVHGMNTRGGWQEALTWLIGRTYRRMVPVAIYKYGKIQPGVLFAFRQRQLMRALTAKMKAVAAESAAAGLDGPPDVIAHSFGTWLVANALLNDESLVIGRLILLGAVVPPGFPWEKLVKRRQIEHILNHGATQDRWVPLAHYGIPDSGPGGTRGFPEPVTNVLATGLGHSDYFAPVERMKGLFETVWRPFLSWNVPQFERPQAQALYWKPSRIIRRVTWLSVVLVLLVVVAVACAVGLLGVRELWRLLWATFVPEAITRVAS